MQHWGMKSPLTQFREDNKLTLEAFGALLHVHKVTILRWETDGVPAERAVEIEKVTKGKLTRQQLRPDLFGEAAA